MSSGAFLGFVKFVQKGNKCFNLSTRECFWSLGSLTVMYGAIFVATHLSIFLGLLGGEERREITDVLLCAVHLVQTSLLLRRVRQP